MKILISPAKKMRSDPDTLAPEALPALLSETERLLSALRAMTPGELQALWRCSDTSPPRIWSGCGTWTCGGG